jgi:hypothetical protein
MLVRLKGKQRQQRCCYVKAIGPGNDMDESSVTPRERRQTCGKHATAATRAALGTNLKP